MINILLNASITGGIVILLWYLTYPLSRKYFKASWHYAILKIIIVFMLFPIGMFAPVLNNVFAQTNLYIFEQVHRVSIGAETINTVNTMLSDFVFPTAQYSFDGNITDGKVNTSPSIPYLQVIWLIIAITLFSYGIRKIYNFKKQILTNSNSNVEYETQELFLQCKKQLEVHGRISLRTSRNIRTPFVFGLIRPTIIFPETGMNANEKRLALLHELTHIRNGDLWLKFLAFVISTVHWFNPFAHLLCRKITFVSEEYCDERVVKTMTQDERFLYGNLILKAVTDITAPPSMFCSTLSASTKNVKRRLLNMMNLKKYSRCMAALSIVTAFILCSFATIYAFAANSNAPKSNTQGSRIIITETNDGLSEHMVYEFVPDEQVVGKWEVVDLVKNIDNFEAGKQWWQGKGLFWLSVEFSEDGAGEVRFDTGVSNNDSKLTGEIRTDSMKWTNGLIELYNTIPEYIIKDINGEKYIFIQWKSGDYTIRKMNPYYYVFKKVSE